MSDKQTRTCLSRPGVAEIMAKASGSSAPPKEIARTAQNRGSLRYLRLLQRRFTVNEMHTVRGFIAEID